MKRSHKKINFIEFIYYHRASYFFANKEEDTKLHKFILDKIEKKEIDNKNFRKYLNLEYIKNEMKKEN